MARVAPINLPYNPKTLWFDPGDMDIRKDDAVVVLTARGLEFGRAADDVQEVEEAAVKSLKTPLKPVKRIATDEDIARAAELEERGREALPVFKEMAAEAHEDMHPVSVEYLFDGDKAVFYFEAEERIDFRDLVRRLASHFHIRVEMRQIGVRDEARIVGGLGHCGQELCCKRLGGEFCPVSIRMAKEQDLSLNSQKISGLCGRLMCCLRYEYDAYKEFKSRAPKMGATIETPDGPAKVTELDVPRETVSLRLEREKPVKVPIAGFKDPKEGSNRPTAVTAEAWEEAQMNSGAANRAEPAAFMTSNFTGNDKLAEAGAVHRNPRSAKKKEEARASEKHSGRGGRNSRGGRRQERPEAADEHRKPRRRSTKIDADAAAAEGRKPRTRRSADRKAGEGERTQRTSQRRSDKAPSKGIARPGQKSSALRHEGEEAKGRPDRGKDQPRRQRKSGNGNARADRADRPERSRAGSDQGAPSKDGPRQGKPRRRHRSSGRSGSGAEGASDGGTSKTE